MYSIFSVKKIFFQGDKGIMGGVGSQLNELANTKRE
jgi:hypothetical protein